jgi:mobilome CxxCx(11)CxxC protein
VKGTSLGSFIEPSWEMLAAILLVFAIVKVVWRWQDRAEKHNKLIGENISLSSQAEQLLNNAGSASPDSAQWFLILANNLEKTDREVLGIVKDEDRKRAYREALKEFSPGVTQVCPECKASPWHYKPGSCQLCGNTPV